MNLLYLFHNYKDGDGGSSAIDFFIEIDKNYCDSYLVVCKQKETTKTINIVEETEIKIIKEFLLKPDILIHYVRSAQSNILEHILKIAGRKIPVVSTVIQSPSYKRLLLSPYEIRNTNYFVFIDKTAYNNSIISFIPTEIRTSIYLVQSKNNLRLEQTKDILLEPNKGSVVFGRGSTMNKCPKDMFTVFDKIDIKDKIFRIVGIPEGDNWVRKEAAKRNNVEVYPQLSFTEWFNICKTFDVFLYQLPFDSYASIDGTLGLAMYMRKPVVYMGSDAPKERIVHGENGYIAHSVCEMAQYATLLGNDYYFRKKIGEEGRKGAIRMAVENNAEARFHEIYNKVYSLNVKKNIPLSYQLKYNLYCFKDIVRNKIDKY